MANFWYIFPIILVIFMFRFIFANLIDAHLAKKEQSKWQQQLNTYRNEAFETKQDLNLIMNSAKFNADHNKRQRRQALDFFNNFPDSSDNEKKEEEEIVPKCNLEICRAGDCGGRQWHSDRSKYSLNQSKDLNNFFNTLKQEDKKMPREISPFESEQDIGEGNDYWKNLNERKQINEGEDIVENMKDNEIIERQTRSKVKSKCKDLNKDFNSKKFLSSSSGEKSKFLNANSAKQISSFYNKDLRSSNSNANADGTISDVSSCQQCAQHADNGIFKNNYKQYKDKPIESSNKTLKFLTKSYKHPTKLVADQNFLEAFERKYSTDDQEDDPDEDEDDSYQIKYPSVQLTRTQHENESEKYICDFPASTDSKNNAKSSMNQTQVTLNDQLDNSKNNLSHEANYKLSKDEQDASENKRDFSWKWNLFKRSYTFNPMNEIKLKTSKRLMKKGFGASLPSYSLGETRKDLMIDGMLRRRQEDMFDERNRKYKNFDNNIENSDMEPNKPAEDFIYTPLSATAFSLLPIDWSLNKQKEISNTDSKYKRELNGIEDQIGSKALEENLSYSHDKNSLMNKDFDAPKANGNSIPTNEETVKMNTVLKAFTVEETNPRYKRQLNEIEDQVATNALEKDSNLFKVENSLTSRSLKTPKTEVIQILNRSDKALNLGTIGINNFQKAFSANETIEAQQWGDNYKDMGGKKPKNAILAENYEISNLRSQRRTKRSIQGETFIRKLANNKNQKLDLKRSKILAKYGEFNKTYFAKPVNKHKTAYKMFKRIKRFDPFKTIQLKIYNKFHSPKALSYNNGVISKKHSKYSERSRTKRSFNDNSYIAKSSAGSPCLLSTLSTVTKKLMKKARRIQKSITNFVETSMTYLPFGQKLNQSSNSVQNLSTKSSANVNYKAFKIESTEQKDFDTTMSYEKTESAVFTDQRQPTEIMISESLKGDIKNISTTEKAAQQSFKSKSIDKIGNPKLKFFKHGLSNLFLFKNDLESYEKKFLKDLKNSRTKRDVKISKALPEKYPLNENNSFISMKLSNAKRLWAKNSNGRIRKSFLKVFIDVTNAKLNFFEKLLSSMQLESEKSNLNNTESFLQNRNNTYKVKSDSKKLLKISKLPKMYEGNNNDTNNYVAESFSKLVPALKFLITEVSQAAKTLVFNNSENGNKIGTNMKTSSNGNETNLRRVPNKSLDPHKQQIHNFLGVALAANLSTFRKELDQTSSFNESYESKRRKKRALENYSFVKPESKIGRISSYHESSASNNLQNNIQAFVKDHPRKLGGTLGLNKSLVLKAKNYYQNYFENFKVKSFPKMIDGRSKRTKRSLDTNLPEDHLTSDKAKYLNKRNYFFYNGDLYKPDYSSDSLYKKPSKQDNDLSESSRIFNSEVYTRNQEPAKSVHKLFDLEEFDNLKSVNPAVEKFEGMKFDNLWTQNNCNKGSKQQKRFSKTLNSQMKSRNSRNALQKLSTDNTKNFMTPKKIKKKKLKSSNLTLMDNNIRDWTDFSKNYKFNENYFNWSKAYPKANMNISNTTTTTTTDNADKLSFDLGSEILNCKAFASLEEFIKSLPKNLTQSLLAGSTESSLNSPATEKIEIDINTSIVTTEVITTGEPIVLGQKVNCSTTPEGQIVDEHTEASVEPIDDSFSQSPDTDYEQTTESSSQDEYTDINFTDLISENATTENNLLPTLDQKHVKLNISLDANVHRNPKNDQCYGNGSFNVMPGVMDDRQRRGAFLPSQGRIQTRQFAQKPRHEQQNEDLGDLVSGKLSSRLVNSILNTVRDSPHLKALWPSLKRDEHLESKAQPNFYAIRNEQNEKQLQEHEQLLGQVMSSINNIIEQQARSRTCVPLRPDLQEFYNMIVQSRQQQDMVREKRQLVKTRKSKDGFSYKIHLLDPNAIEQETKIVKKLLQKYDELPQEDQKQVAVARDDLVKNLIILRQLQDKEEQQERELREEREHDWYLRNEEIMKSLENQYSPQFLKLLNAAELYREINSD